MLQTTRDKLRAILPHLNESEFAAACERFQRYVRLAVEISRTKTYLDVPLTESPTGVSVNPGKVDPSRTFTNTG